MTECMTCKQWVEPYNFCTHCGEKLSDQATEEAAVEEEFMAEDVRIKPVFSWIGGILGVIVLCLFVDFVIWLFSGRSASATVMRYLIPWYFFLPLLFYSWSTVHYAEYMLTRDSLIKYFKGKKKWEIPLAQINSVKIRGRSIGEDGASGSFYVYAKEGRKIMDAIPEVKRYYSLILKYRSQKLKQVERSKA